MIKVEHKVVVKSVCDFRTIKHEVFDDYGRAKEIASKYRELYGDSAYVTLATVVKANYSRRGLYE